MPESLPAITGREDAWRREAEVCHDILHGSLAAQKKSLTVIGHHPQDEGLRPRGRCSCQAKCIDGGEVTSAQSHWGRGICELRDAERVAKEGEQVLVQPIVGPLVHRAALQAHV